MNTEPTPAGTLLSPSSCSDAFSYVIAILREDREHWCNDSTDTQHSLNVIAEIDEAIQLLSDPNAKCAGTDASEQKL